MITFVIYLWQVGGFPLVSHVINLIQPYMITFVIYLWQVGGFPLVSHVINLIQPYMITFVIYLWQVGGFPLVSTNNKTEGHAIMEILLNVVLNDTNNVSVVFLLYIFVLVNIKIHPFNRYYKNTPFQSLL
jgi:hypothetical protein